MKQDNYGGNNYQTQTGENNTNFFGGQHQHYHSPPQPSLEESILEEYYKKAGELISDSYVRNCEPFIDERCNSSLGRLQSGLRLTSEKTRDIKEEILKLCENYGEPFRQHIQDLKSILSEYGAFSHQVHEWLEDCPKFLRDRQFVGVACSLVGYQLYVEDNIEAASGFISEVIRSYPDSPSAYVTQGLIYCKQGNLKQSLKTINQRNASMRSKRIELRK